MLYSIKNREELQKWNEAVSLESQVKVVRLQDKLGKQNLHEDLMKVYKPVTKPLENTSQGITKTVMETSKNNNQALAKLNSKLLEIMNNRGIFATFLI